MDNPPKPLLKSAGCCPYRGKAVCRYYSEQDVKSAVLMLKNKVRHVTDIDFANEIIGWIDGCFQIDEEKK